jgi:hypothetical protein
MTQAMLFLPAATSFSGQLAFAPRALVDDLVTAVIGQFFPFACFDLGAQATGAKAGAAVKLALLDTGGLDCH